MIKRQHRTTALLRATLVALLLGVGLALGCEAGSPAAPEGSSTATPITVTTATPASGSNAEPGTPETSIQLAVGGGTSAQPSGIELNPNGLSHIWWMFDTPRDDWFLTCGVGCGGHGGDDYFANDWGRAAAGGQTKEQRTFGQTVFAGISGTAIAMPNHGPFGNDLVIYDATSRFALRYAHLSEILVASGQHVDAGSPVAKVGRSGNVTGPHLHAVLYKNVANPNSRPIRWATINGGPTPLVHVG